MLYVRRDRRRWSIGNVLTAVGMFAGLVAFAMHLEHRLTNIEASIEAITKQHDTWTRNGLIIPPRAK